MDEHGRRTAAVTAVFLLLAAVLIAYNALHVPPLVPDTAQVMASVTTRMDGESSFPASSAEDLSQGPSSEADSQPSAVWSDPDSTAEPLSAASSSKLNALSASSSRVSSQAAPSASSAAAGSSSVAKRTMPPAQPDINLSTATAEELCAIPKIGPVLAGRIVEYRDAYGPLSSLDELLEVKGIGEKLYQTLCQYVYLG